MVRSTCSLQNFMLKMVHLMKICFWTYMSILKVWFFLHGKIELILGVKLVASKQATKRGECNQTNNEAQKGQQTHTKKGNKAYEAKQGCKNLYLNI